jgi:hypothetical protein
MQKARNNFPAAGGLYRYRAQCKEENARWEKNIEFGERSPSDFSTRRREEREEIRDLPRWRRGRGGWKEKNPNLNSYSECKVKENLSLV